MTKEMRYYWKHKDEIRERRRDQDKKYYLKNKEVIKQKCKLYSQSEAGKISQRNRTIRKRDKHRWYYNFRGRIRSMFGVNPPEATAEMFRLTVIRRMIQKNMCGKRAVEIAKELSATQSKKKITNLAREVYGTTNRLS